jgi:putative salt-induced outer membrane protein
MMTAQHSLENQTMLAKLGTLLLVITASPLLAQAPVPRPVEFTGDVGFVNTAGNTDVTTINVGEKLTRNLTRFTLKQFFSVVYGNTDGQTTTNLWQTGLRGDYNITQRFLLFGTAGYDRNTFAGISRRFGEGVGVGFKAVDQPDDKLEFEVGLELTQQRSTLDVDNDFTAARTAGAYRHNFTETAYFLQNVEVLPDLKQSDDLRINTETGIVAPLSNRFAIKLSYVIHFDNLPEPGFKKTDRLLTSGLQISL